MRIEGYVTKSLLLNTKGREPDALQQKVPRKAIPTKGQFCQWRRHLVVYDFNAKQLMARDESMETASVV
jgi:hypothetical protein